MTAPYLLGTWWSQGNAPLPDTSTATNINNSVLFMLKELLKGTSTSGTQSGIRPAGSVWTVVGSSDGVTASLDGVDRLTGSVANSYDSTKWVHAASGTAHSWIVLKSPNALGPVYMCIDCNSATTTTNGIVCSRQAMTSGTTIGRPDANNAWCAGSTTNPNQTTNALLMTEQTTGQVYRSNICVDASGAFHYFLGRNGTGIACFQISVINMVETIAAETHPTFTIFSQATTTRGVPKWDNIGNAQTGMVGRTIDGTTITTTGGASTWSFGVQSPGGFAGLATVDSGSTNFRVLPIYNWCGVTDKHAWRGRVPDMWIVGAVTLLDTYPTGSQQFQVIGDVLLPFQLTASF